MEDMYCSNDHDHSSHPAISVSREEWSKLGGFGNNFHQVFSSGPGLNACADCAACAAACAAAAAASTAANTLWVISMPPTAMPPAAVGEPG